MNTWIKETLVSSIGKRKRKTMWEDPFKDLQPSSAVVGYDSNGSTQMLKSISCKCMHKLLLAEL